MNNPKIDPAENAQLIELEVHWSQLNWIQRKTLNLQVHLTVMVIRHITETTFLRDRIRQKIDRFVLYYIFPAHWLKD